MNNMLGMMGAMLGTWLILNLVGALVMGAIARRLLPGKDKVGWFTTILVGFMGGVVANIVAHLAGWVPWGKNVGILGSLAGSMGLLLLHRLWAMTQKVVAKQTPPPTE